MMIDREKVIKGITHHKLGMCDMSGKICPYWNEDDGCSKKMLEDVLSLLKEQEAVKPILEQDSMVCGVCGHEVIWQKMLGDGILVDETLDYCPHCGRAVKWE